MQPETVTVEFASRKITFCWLDLYLRCFSGAKHGFELQIVGDVEHAFVNAFRFGFAGDFSSWPGYPYDPYHSGSRKTIHFPSPLMIRYDFCHSIWCFSLCCRMSGFVSTYPVEHSTTIVECWMHRIVENNRQPHCSANGDHHHNNLR